MCVCECVYMLKPTLPSALPGPNHTAGGCEYPPAPEVSEKLRVHVYACVVGVCEKVHCSLDTHFCHFRLHLNRSLSSPLALCDRHGRQQLHRHHTRPLQDTGNNSQNCTQVYDAYRRKAAGSGPGRLAPLPTARSVALGRLPLRPREGGVDWETVVRQQVEVGPKIGDEGEVLGTWQVLLAKSHPRHQVRLHDALAYGCGSERVPRGGSGETRSARCPRRRGKSRGM